MSATIPDERLPPVPRPGGRRPDPTRRRRDGSVPERRALVRGAEPVHPKGDAGGHLVAAEAGKAASVSALLKQGPADVEAADAREETALIIAAKLGHAAVADVPRRGTGLVVIFHNSRLTD